MRKRHFIVTAFELLIPLSLTFLFVYLRSLAGSMKNYTPSDGQSSRFHNFTSFDPYPVNRLSYMKDAKIFYVPNNTLAQDLLQQAIAKYSDETPIFKGFNSEKELIAYYLKDNVRPDYDDMPRPSYKYYNYYGFTFNNLDNGLPDWLDYKIRINDYFQTKSKFNDFSNSDGPNRYESYYSTKFWEFQSAIDQAFIDLKTTGLKKTPVIHQYLQRFPYPEYVESYSSIGIATFIAYIVVYGLSTLATVFVKRIVDEKVNRAKELMRMMGMNDFVYFTGIFMNTFIIMFIIASIMSILFTINIAPDVAVLDYTDGSLFFVILFLYMINALLFCMAISTFFNKSVLAAIVTFMVWCVSHSVPTNLLDPIGMGGKYAQLSLGAKLGTSLLPNCAIHWACRIIAIYENNRTQLFF